MRLRRSRSNCSGPSSNETGRYRSAFCSNVFSLLSIILLTALPAHTERLPIKNYTTADGLAHNIVNKIVRDSRGFLWFCTADGLSRFDGYAFTNYGTNRGLPHASVNEL